MTSIIRLSVASLSILTLLSQPTMAKEEVVSATANTILEQNLIEKDSKPPEFNMYVAAEEGLNIREESNTDSRILGALPYQQSVTLDGVTSGEEWYHLKSGGYLCARYLSPDKPKDLFVSLGEYKLTFYCNCEICCGKWAHGKTRSGTYPKEGRTIAVDPDVIPLGSKVYISGHEYVAEDTGSAIKGNRIDVYLDSHEECNERGIEYAEVYVER